MNVNNYDDELKPAMSILWQTNTNKSQKKLNLQNVILNTNYSQKMPPFVLRNKISNLNDYNHKLKSGT